MDFTLLCRALMEDKMITEAQQEDAQNLVATGSHALIACARACGGNHADVSEQASVHRLLEWLSRRCGHALWTIDPLRIDMGAATGVISREFALHHGILIVARDGKNITVAHCDPWRMDWLQQVKDAQSRRVIAVLANPTEIERQTLSLYRVASSVSQASSDAVKGQFTGIEHLLGGEDSSEERHISAIFDWLLEYAFRHRASDIHIEPRREFGRVRLRVDGVLRMVYELPASIVPGLLSHCKIIARLDVAEKRRPQDGRSKKINDEDNEVELRLSTLPSAFGEKLVIRIFDPKNQPPNFEAMGLSEPALTHWRQILSRPNGIALVTGPTGSGKTSMMYNSLRGLATPEVNVCTIEDPVEIIEPAFNQTQVQSDIGLSFASGIRAVLRQDPDIIMIGEIRDSETAAIALQAALTGHLVLSTLHTNDSFSAITRLLELGAPAYMIRATLLGVAAQRLLRRLCVHCRAPQNDDPANLWSALCGKDCTPPKQWFAPGSCDQCNNSGYHGRLGVFEILSIDSALRRLITDSCAPDSLRAAASDTPTLRASAARLVVSGATSLEEALRVL